MDRPMDPDDGTSLNGLCRWGYCGELALETRDVLISDPDAVIIAPDAIEFVRISLCVRHAAECDAHNGLVTVVAR
jgi:hypothetical protein